MHAISPRALAGTLGRARWRTVGAAIAAGVAGPALFVIPALAQVGNQAPVATDDSYAIVQNTATVLAVLGNDTDADGDTLSIQSVSVPAHGTAALAAGILTYTPTAAYTGSDSFTYTVGDGHGNFDTATVNLAVAPTVGVPNAQDDTASVAMNTATSITVLANDTDPDGHTLTVTAVSTPAHGTATIVGGTTITYTPTAAYTGADSFTYTVSDGFGSTDTATVNITVAATTNAPNAQNDTATVAMNTATSIAVLANDTDADGQTLTITAVSTPAHGTAAIVGGTSITYTPTAGYTGADAFSYTISDGAGGTDIANVTVTVGGDGAAPVVQNDVVNALLNTSTVINVLSNDSDPNGDALTITSVSAPSHGTATITGTATTVTYVPAAGYIGADSFSYTVSDGHGNSASAMVAIVVAAQGTLIANNDAASTRVDTAKRIAVLSNDEPGDEAHTLTVTAVSTPAHGTAAITDEAKKVTYTPAAGYVGTDTFVYTVTETGGATATATVTVTIRPASTDDDDDDDKDDCKDGRWVRLGFRNQGLCIAAANHGFMHNGQPLFPNGLFPNGLFPNGLFPKGIFFDKDCDDDDDENAVRREQSNVTSKHSDDDDRSSKADAKKSGSWGKQISAQVKASLNASRDNDNRGKGRGH